MDQQEMNKDFMGIGWSFPLDLGEDGNMKMVAYEQDIHQAIHIILGTVPGERVMRPDFGTGLGALVFEPVNTTTMTLVQQRVEQALVTWEPRIDLMEVRVETDPQMRNKLLIHIDYRVRTTNTFYNLVYPFYLAEGEPT